MCVWLWWMVSIYRSSIRPQLLRAHSEETAEKPGWCGWMAVGVFALCVYGEAFRSWSTASSCVLLTNTMTSASIRDASSFARVGLAIKLSFEIHFLTICLLCFAAVDPVPPMMLCQLFFSPWAWQHASVAQFTGSLSRSNACFFGQDLKGVYMRHLEIM